MYQAKLCEWCMEIMWNGQEERRKPFVTDYSRNGRHVLSATGALRLATSKYIYTHSPRQMLFNLIFMYIFHSVVKHTRRVISMKTIPCVFSPVH